MALSGGAGYYPYLRLYGSNGVLLASDADQSDSFLAYRTTNAGPFTVVLGSYYQGYTGGYRLRFAQMPGAFIVPPGNDGGVLAARTDRFGTNDLGDEGMWSFIAYKGAPMTLSAQRLAGTFNPYIRLCGPNGVLLASAVNANVATLNYTPTNHGTFTLLLGSGSAGLTGTYRLSGTNISDGLELLDPVFIAGNLNIPAAGGASNVLFVLYASTNLAQPLSSWPPVLTNRLDGAGAFVFTNLSTPALREQFFHLAVP